MPVAVAPVAREGTLAGLAPLDMAAAGSLETADVLARLGGPNADFRTGTSALGLSEFEAELASTPPGDGGAGGEAGLAEDG